MFSYYFQSCLKRARNFQPLFKTVFLVGLLLLLLCNPQRFFEGWSILVLQYTHPLGSDNALGPFFDSWQSTRCCTGTDGIFSFFKVLAVPLPACPAGEWLFPGSMSRGCSAAQTLLQSSWIAHPDPDEPELRVHSEVKPDQRNFWICLILSKATWYYWDQDHYYRECLKAEKKKQ